MALRGKVKVARLVGQLVLLWLNALRAPHLDAATRRRHVERWARRTLAQLGVEVVVRGTPPPADEPLLLVANHVSWLDVYALNTVAESRFVAKADVATWPILGRITRGYGSLLLVRGSIRAAYRVKNQAAHALRSGDRVAVFPEGTTTDGNEIRRFHPAMLQAAIDAGVRVQPVGIRYPAAGGGANQAAVFIDDMTFVESLRRVLGAGRLRAELVFCDPITASGRSRRDLADAARGAIAAVLGLEPQAGAPRTLRPAA